MPRRIPVQECSASRCPTRNATMEPTLPKTASRDFRPQLVDVLMRQREAQPVFPRFRQDGHERIRSERLEFVHVEEKVPALRFRHVRPRHGGKLELRHQERAHEIRLVRPQLSFGHVRDENAAVVHHEAGVDPAPHLSQDVPHVRRHEQLPDFVLDRRNRFMQKLSVVVLQIHSPKTTAPSGL